MGLPFSSRSKAARASASQAKRRFERCQHFCSQLACALLTCRCTLCWARCRDAGVHTMTQRSVPCGSVISRLNQCMVPSSEWYQVLLPSCKTVLASVKVSETRLTHGTPAWFSCFILDWL